MPQGRKLFFSALKHHLLLQIALCWPSILLICDICLKRGHHMKIGQNEICTHKQPENFLRFKNIHRCCHRRTGTLLKTGAHGESQASGTFLFHLSQLEVPLMSGQQLPLFYQLHPPWARRLPQALRGGQCETSESLDQLSLNLDTNSLSLIK